MSSFLEPTRHPLLFLNGSPGWCPKTTDIDGKRVSMHEYHKYFVHDRLPSEVGGVVLPQHRSMLWSAYMTLEHARCEANTLAYHETVLRGKMKCDTKAGMFMKHIL